MLTVKYTVFIMRLYAGSAQEFVSDVTHNLLSDKLNESFTAYYGRRPAPSEITSWTNSLQFVKTLVDESKLYDAMLVLEFELPYSTMRIDCLFFGGGVKGEDNVVLMELKQWSNVKDCEIDGNVVVYMGHAERQVPHPSQQVGEYRDYLQDFVTFFEEEPNVKLSSCVYCHNYSKKQETVLSASKFNDYLRESPLFCKEDFDSLSEYLKSKLSKGSGLELFNRFVISPIRPSKKLVEHTHHMITGQKVFHLIDDQLAANNAILDRAKKASKLKKKTVIIVRGGPGTGKSVIALNVLAELLSKQLTVYHATGSAAFTTTLRKIVGSRTANFFKYFNSFQATQSKENAIDVLICDEAHRIRKTSNSMYTKKEFRSDTPQIEELMRVAKVLIFFIDDYQVVRPEEIGSTQLILDTAKKLDAEVFDFELKTQFRCNGSDGYLNWIDSTLGIRETANPYLTKSEKMDFKIFDSPQALYAAIKEKNNEKPNSARLVAGFCWPWSNANPDGTLKEDVVIGDFKMTWEAKNDAKNLAKGIPKAALWAYDPNGINQIGSIYTIQGFEFDYVGVIVGKDLIYDSSEKEWFGKPENSADAMVKRSKENFLKNVRNAYRVLFTRGMKGCYVYFLDEDTKNFFKSRLQDI